MNHFHLTGIFVLLLLAGCAPRQLLNSGSFSQVDGALYLYFEAQEPNASAKTDQKVRKSLRIKLPEPDETGTHYFPCTNCLTKYEEGVMLLNFGSSTASGELVISTINDKKITGTINFRFIAPYTGIESDKQTVLLQGEFKARKSDKLPSF